MKFVFAILLSVLIISGCATSAVSPAKKVVNSTMDLDLTDGFSTGADPDQQKLDRILDVTGGQDALKLNWQLRFAVADNFDCPNDVIEPGDLADYPTKTSLPYATYSLPMSTYSTHFIMDVIVGSPVQYPFNAVTCSVSNREAVIGISGYYSAILYDVATAFAVELRPLNVQGVNDSL